MLVDQVVQDPAVNAATSGATVMESTDSLIVPRGFRAGAVKAGIKPSGGLDLAIIAADGPCAAAGTFTTNRICAAPVRWCRDHVPADDIRAIVINAGNANAATGAEGAANVARTAEQAAALLGCEPGQVLVASTGVIGRQLPMDRLEEGLKRAAAQLSAEPPASRPRPRPFSPPTPIPRSSRSTSGLARRRSPCWDWPRARR